MKKGMKPTLCIGKKPYYVRFVGVNRETGEEKNVHPKEASNIARLDSYARAFGYERIRDTV